MAFPEPEVAEEPPLGPTPPAVAGTTGALRLDRPSALPGGRTTVRGAGCPPGSDVALTIDGRSVGSAAADADGRFEATLSLESFGIGRHLVVATCGGTRLEVPLDLVVTASRSGTALASAVAAGAVLCFFVLLALLLTEGRQK